MPCVHPALAFALTMRALASLATLSIEPRLFHTLMEDASLRERVIAQPESLERFERAGRRSCRRSPCR